MKNGRSAHRPQVYPTPFEDEDNIFYMMCPIGDGRKDGRTQFVPENSAQVTQEKSERLSALLSANITGWMPIIRYLPILLQEEDIEHSQIKNLDHP